MTNHTVTNDQDAGTRIADTTPADLASRNILNSLVEIIHATEPGIIRRTDAETLHAYRIAVRKTRTLLTECEHVFTKHDLNQARKYFSWLGELTGPVRDLDIHLQMLNDYTEQLTIEQRQLLLPYHQQLRNLHAEKYQQLIHALTSAHYRKSQEKFVAFLQKPVAASTTLKFAKWPIKLLVDRCIHKLYKKAVKHAEKIDLQTPPAYIHKLRKLCKKLRYLLDLFQPLYDANRLKIIIKSLKKIQDALGDFNDSSVQAIYLRKYLSQYKKVNDPNKAYLEVLNNLLADIDDRTTQARNHLQEQIAGFFCKDIRQSIETL